MKALLLDAGNTVVFLDHDVVGEIVGLAGSVVQAAERAAKDRYAMTLKSGAAHDDAWGVFMRTLVETAGAGGDVDQHVEQLRAEHDRLNLWRRVPDDLIDALADAKAAGWTIAIVSNSEGKLVELFDAVGLGDEFEVIVDSANVGVRKPDPRIFEIALKALGATAADAVYAGDVPEVDLVGAAAAGIEAFLIDPHDDYALASENGATDEALALGRRVSSVRELVDELLTRTASI